MGLFDFFRKGGAKDSLFLERQKIIDELKEAEKNFLQHKIDKVTFDTISRERNSDLIRVEADIDARRHGALNKDELRLAKGVSADKQKIICGLLAAKQKKVYELKLAENRYYKRRISEEVFKKISGEVKMEIIAIDSQIKAIGESEAINRLKESLKSGASEIAKQQKLSEVRCKEELANELEEEIFEQAKDLPVDGAQRVVDNKKSDFFEENRVRQKPIVEPEPDARVPRRLRRQRGN